MYYVLLRDGAPAPNPTQILNAQDSANATSVCYDHIDEKAPRKSKRCYFADNSLTDSSGSMECTNTGTITTGDGTNSFWATPCAFPTFTNLTRATTFNLLTVVTHINATTLSDSTGPDGDAVYYAEFTVGSVTMTKSSLVGVTERPCMMCGGLITRDYRVLSSP